MARLMWVADDDSIFESEMECDKYEQNIAYLKKVETNLTSLLTNHTFFTNFEKDTWVETFITLFEEIKEIINDESNV